MKKYLILFLFVLFPLILLAQDKSDDKGVKDKTEDTSMVKQGDLKPMTPKQPIFNLETQLNFGKHALKNGGFLKAFQIYQAVRNDNVSSCDSDQCKAIAPALLWMRYAGEDRCGEIKDPSMQQLCQAVNSNKCDALGSDKKKFCQSFLQGDAKSLAEGARNFEITQSLGFAVREPEALMMLGIYNGFKQYNVMACERYSNQVKASLSKKFACKVIFAQNPDKEIESLTNDLALFFVSRHNSKPELCDSVIDNSVRQACQDSTIKELIEIW